MLVPLGEGVGFEPGGSCDWAVDSIAAHKRSATTPLDQLSLQKSFSHNEMSPQFFLLKSQIADSVAYFCFTAIAEISTRASFTIPDTWTVARVGLGSGMMLLYALFISENSLMSDR